MTVSDAELVLGAARGDAGSLGALLQRHHAALLGLAVSLVGHDDAEDVVHDAFLVGLRRIGDLRDPAAAGAWLRAIVRTECLMRLRARREYAVEDVTELSDPAPDATPEEALERLALRDWTWAALERLTEPLRVAVILRHFGSRSSYEEIAAILDVPVGTVRSRLNQARLKLADLLLEQASRTHPDMAQRQIEGEQLYGEAFASANRDDFSIFATTLADDVLGATRTGPPIRGRDELVWDLYEGTQAVGVRIHVDRVIASARITVVEARFENPAEAPEHCPPATTQVHFHPEGRTSRILFAFPSRDPRAVDAEKR